MIVILKLFMVAFAVMIFKVNILSFSVMIWWLLLSVVECCNEILLEVSLYCISQFAWYVMRYQWTPFCFLLVALYSIVQLMTLSLFFMHLELLYIFVGDSFILYTKCFTSVSNYLVCQVSTFHLNHSNAVTFLLNSFPAVQFVQKGRIHTQASQPDNELSSLHWEIELSILLWEMAEIWTCQWGMIWKNLCGGCLSGWGVWGFVGELARAVCLQGWRCGIMFEIMFEVWVMCK